MRKQDHALTHTHGASASPCVRNCCLDEDDVCLGCGRSLDEIRNWTLVDEPERQHIRELASERVRLRRRQYPL